MAVKVINVINNVLDLKIKPLIKPDVDLSDSEADKTNGCGTRSN